MDRRRLPDSEDKVKQFWTGWKEDTGHGLELFCYILMLVVLPVAVLIAKLLQG